MTTINLRDYYSNYYIEDSFIEVSDDVAAFLNEDKRLQTNYRQYIRDNKAFYSLDADDGIEYNALHKPEQPDEAIERQELSSLLSEALVGLSETQRRRLLAHVTLELRVTDIAKTENVHESSVRESISRATNNLKKTLKNGW